MVDRFVFPEASWKINQFGNWVRIADYEAIEKKANDASAQLEACRSLNASLRVEIEALRARLETVEAETREQCAKVADAHDFGNSDQECFNARCIAAAVRNLEPRHD